MNGARLAVDALRFAYPGASATLDDISFTVEPGEHVAFLGPNGAGKSTLLLHLNGLLLPEAGQVTVAGIEVSPDTARDVRRLVGLVFQDPDDQLFLPTLLEDVAFGPLNHGDDSHAAEHAARHQLESFGLLHAAHRAAHHLSGGEKRLASLATVLVMRPSILALDEPTADLDARARRRVIDTLRQRDETLLVATHDLGLARDLCPRSIILDEGAMVADNRTATLLADAPLLRKHGLLDPADGAPGPLPT